MKRDMDLIRSILVQVEAVSGEPVLLSSDTIQLEDYDSATVAYHVRLLIQAGFIDGVGADLAMPHTFNIRELTWQGCEFLALARNDTIWNRTKAAFVERGLDFAVSFGSEFMAALAFKMATTPVG